MTDTIPPINSLVLYKNRAAWVKQSSDKLEIEQQDGKTVKVRPKDVDLLHPGPLTNWAELNSLEGELVVAWELLAGETTTLSELAELIYETYTPATAWATWLIIDDGIYFEGTLTAVTARTPEEVEAEQQRRAQKESEAQQWADFIASVKAGNLNPEDAAYMQDVVAVALQQQIRSRVLRELNQAETRENAHALLLALGVWDNTYNPYPERLNISTASPITPLPDLPSEERRDLTHLPAFAIDDAGSNDPDDALSLDGNRLWVHVADVAALVKPESPADLEARGRATNLYLPEGTVHMLPAQATAMLALGLQPVSPALSFGLDLDERGEVINVEIVPSFVKVTRLSYDEVETRLKEDPFAQFHAIAQRNIARREVNGAIQIDLPEVKLRVKDGLVHITPIYPLYSRDLVREAMLLCGEGLAHFAQQQDIPFAFSTQEAPEVIESPDGLAGMVAQRRKMKPSQLKSIVNSHAGLGLSAYAQATSPLRRYVDLVIHQQLRAYLKGSSMFDTQEILERVGAARAVSGVSRQAERLSNKHWTMVYLIQNPDWEGEGIIIDKRYNQDIVLIPDLDLEVRLHIRQNLDLNNEITVALSEVNLPELEAYFQVARSTR